ncbi:MAG: GNAT family N-acetyltransferase, partial [Clostridiales bacterium]|nr:GNAT family N-acetyltransferase [Clostridiales bacterium]
IIFDGDTYHLGRIAVLKECRGRQLGDFLVRMMADRCFAHGAREVHLGAQDHAVGFYRKIGFEVCGEEYDDAGIPHFPMVLKREDFHGQCGHAISYGDK